MASSIDFVHFVCDQTAGAGEITHKKMFGEYGIYCNGKYYAAICDNRLLVKVTDAGKRLMPDYKLDYPYTGAKPMLLVEDVENRDLLTQLALVTCAELPEPKTRKKG